MKHPSFIIRAVLILLIIGQASISGIAQTSASIATNEEAEALVAAHNQWRSEVGVPPVKWSNTIAASAREWALSLEKNCAFKHSKVSYGENLWKGTAGYFNVTDVVNSWGSEKADYQYQKNKCKTGKVCGHYTQIVWETTTEIGCAKMTCEGMTTWVCQYNPPGNWVGQKPY